MYDENGAISTGTAFLFESEREWFLITNWHNITGRHFLTKYPLSKTGRLPTYITAKFLTYPQKSEKPEENEFIPVAHRIDIYKDYQPVWFEHPVIESDCDVVAIPFVRPNDGPSFIHSGANLISSDKIPIEPGGNVFIIGFPSSISTGPGLPIWKSGYVASEPFYDITLDGEISPTDGMISGKTIPAFFIDSQTRQGMSGSPIFATYNKDPWDMTNPYKPVDMSEPNFWSRNDIVILGQGVEFLGCYSGRVGKKEEGAALGLCWGVKVIETICAHKKIANHPHIDIEND